jgi:hypothetical protein
MRILAALRAEEPPSPEELDRLLRALGDPLAAEARLRASRSPRRPGSPPIGHGVGTPSAETPPWDSTLATYGGYARGPTALA